MATYRVVQIPTKIFEDGTYRLGVRFKLQEKTLFGWKDFKTKTTTRGSRVLEFETQDEAENFADPNKICARVVVELIEPAPVYYY